MNADYVDIFDSCLAVVVAEKDRRVDKLAKGQREHSTGMTTLSVSLASCHLQVEPLSPSTYRRVLADALEGQSWPDFD